MSAEQASELIKLLRAIDQDLSVVGGALLVLVVVAAVRVALAWARRGGR
jgi:hypothetical protein